MFLYEFLQMTFKNGKIASKRANKEKAHDCDFNNLATTTFKFLFLSYGIIY